MIRVRVAVLLLSFFAVGVGCSGQKVSEGENGAPVTVLYDPSPMPVRVFQYWADPESNKVSLIIHALPGSTGDRLEITETPKRAKVYMLAEAPDPDAGNKTYRVDITLKSPLGDRPLVDYTGPKPERLNKDFPSDLPPLTPSKVIRK